MADYDPTAYGGAVADVYDELYDSLFDTDGAVRCLRELAGTGSVLELGVGTGRLALPLAAGGLRVHGVDASEEMLARLRAKLGGSQVDATLADFSSFQSNQHAEQAGQGDGHTDCLDVDIDDDYLRCIYLPIESRLVGKARWWSLARHEDEEALGLRHGPTPARRMAGSPAGAPQRQAPKRLVDRLFRPIRHGGTVCPCLRAL